MGTQYAIIVEPEDAVKGGSREHRVDTFKRVTDLFPSGASRFNDTQIKLVDDVLCHRIKRIESKAAAAIGWRLEGARAQ
jgi:hypothetical protein